MLDALLIAMADDSLRAPVRGPIHLVTGLPEPTPWWQEPVVWWSVLSLAVLVFICSAIVFVWRQSVLRRPGDVAFAQLARTMKVNRTQAAAVRIAAERVGVPPIAVLLSDGAAKRVPGIDAVLKRQ